MKKIEIEIPEGKKAEWVNGVLTLVDDTPKDITERIKTFEGAFRALGEEHPLIREFINKSYCSSPDLEAYMKLRIICAALNEGWKADFSNFAQEKWFPWFCIKGDKLVFGNAYNAWSYSYS